MEPALPPEGQEARVVDLRPRHAARRLGEAQTELGALRGRLAEVLRERDLARAAARDALADALAAREELAARLSAESAAVGAVAALRGRVEELRVRAEARDARDATLARLAGELATTARVAREDVERHAGARAQAEAALEAERRRVEETQAALAAEHERASQSEGALRAELEALRSARERAVSAEADAQAARQAELEALRAAGARLRPLEPVGDGDLVADLGRAAQRLRLDSNQAPERPSRLRRAFRRLRRR
jgi:chromosome segregation ATPase